MITDSIYEIICGMFGKKGTDYAIEQANNPRPPGKPHKRFCKLDKDHIGDCRSRILTNPAERKPAWQPKR